MVSLLRPMIRAQSRSQSRFPQREYPWRLYAFGDSESDCSITSLLFRIKIFTSNLGVRECAQFSRQ
jgi:hypothetical protein